MMPRLVTLLSTLAMLMVPPPTTWSPQTGPMGAATDSSTVPACVMLPPPEFTDETPDVVANETPGTLRSCGS